MTAELRCDLCCEKAEVLAADWSENARGPFAVADRWVCEVCRPERFAFLIGGDVMLDELFGWWGQ